MKGAPQPLSVALNDSEGTTVFAVVPLLCEDKNEIGFLHCSRP
jgi:hypothetical protein